MRAAAAAILMTSTLITFSPYPARALTACTSVPTAALSHFVPNNAQYGGHLAAHVVGAVPPNGYTQNGRTLFSSGADYNEAWSELAAQQQPLYCPDNPQLGADAARDLLLQFFSESCTAAAGNGVCTHSNTIQTHRVTFDFRAVQYNNHPTWILLTAYPRN
jgi:hypothetical protein